MAPIRNLWTKIIYVFDFFTGGIVTDTSHDLQVVVQPSVQATSLQPSLYPVWTPPDNLEDPTFQCKYPSYLTADGWTMCNNNTNRQCWLANTKTGQKFDVHIDYEDNGPIGVTRYYYLNVTQTTLSPDGYADVYAQIFNKTFPGPRIQACWGDRIEVTIKNDLPATNSNGTSVHWHGIRQLNTGWNDGVNAVTQCPIPPGESFTYVFNATQYGTSWYHSHYSLQYAAGLLGPLTLYGPTSHNYDHQVSPIIMSDWSHQSIFDPQGQGEANILQNGIGHWPQIQEKDLKVQDFHISDGTQFNEITFQHGVKYLLRLVNGAADTSFVFSIDNHKFKVISTDFVAIKPYDADHINIGIGQRYNIVVEACPDSPNSDGNYWIRQIPVGQCSGWNTTTNDGLGGIVRYKQNTKLPTSTRSNYDIDCADETYNKTLSPIYKWTVDPSSMLELPPLYLFGHTIPNQPCPYQPCNETRFHFELVPSHPLWLNFSAATIVNVNQDFAKKPWLAEISTDTTAKKQQWVKITIISGEKQTNAPLLGSPAVPNPDDAPAGLNIPSYHPIHLHGHDFVILDQCVPTNTTPCDASNAKLNIHNPPRRDVAFLPGKAPNSDQPLGGYLILGFKPDNPGVWLLHCHIAQHASLGLAAQIVENKARFPDVFGFGWDEEINQQCESWLKYCNDSASCQQCYLENDSGI